MYQERKYHTSLKVRSIQQVSLVLAFWYRTEEFVEVSVFRQVDTEHLTICLNKIVMIPG